MDKDQINDIITTGIKVGALGLAIFYFRRIGRFLYNVVAGPDKIVTLIELGAVWGVWRLDYMLRMEASREHEWTIYNEIYIISILIFILLCFGFKDIVKLFISRKYPEKEAGS